MKSKEQGKVQGKLEVIVCKEATSWGRELKESRSFSEFMKNFPRTCYGAEVEVKNLDNDTIYYLNTNFYGECTAKVPMGNYQVTVDLGEKPSKNISILNGKKSRMYFSVKVEDDDYKVKKK